MPAIELYTIASCPFCQSAKTLLRSKGVDFKDYDVSHLSDRELNEMILKMTNGVSRTVPAIWIGGRFVGGCEELLELEQTGELDRLLGRS